MTECAYLLLRPRWSHDRASNVHDFKESFLSNLGSLISYLLSSSGKRQIEYFTSFNNGFVPPTGGTLVTVIPLEKDYIHI